MKAILTSVLTLLGAALLWGSCEHHGRARAEAHAAALGDSVAVKRLETARLAAALERQTAAVDSLHAEGDRLARRVAASRREATAALRNAQREAAAMPPPADSSAAAAIDYLRRQARPLSDRWADDP